MMPTALKVVLTLILSLSMGGTLVYLISHMMNHPEEWFPWRKDFWEKLDLEDEDEEGID